MTGPPPNPPAPDSKERGTSADDASASRLGEAAPAGGLVERRRPGWRDFRRAYSGLITAFWLALLALAIGDGWLVYKGKEYAAEAARLRQSMTGVERQRADVVFAANKGKLQVMVELARRQAGGDRDLHLSVSVDSGTMFWSAKARYCGRCRCASAPSSSWERRPTPCESRRRAACAR